VARPRAPSATVLPRAAVFVIGVFLLQQIVVSALAIESEPLVSNFPMYAHSYASRAAFDEHLRARTRRYVLATASVPAPELDRRLRALPKAGDILGAAIDEAAAGGGLSEETAGALDVLLQEYRREYGEPLGALHVRRYERPFDWTRGTFDDEPRLTLDTTLTLNGHH
jgi:hypothetical protein